MWSAHEWVLDSYNNLLDVGSFNNALAADPVSAFGGVLISDAEINLETATEIDRIFYEICIAPSYSEEAQEFLSRKGKRILLKWDKKTLKQLIKRTILNGMLIQKKLKKKLRTFL